MKIQIRTCHSQFQQWISKHKFLLFASPWIIGFIAFTLIPMLSSLLISFTEWNILTPPKFAGLENYKSVFADPLFYKSLKVTLVYTFVSVPINVTLAFFAALLLNTDIKFINVYRTIYYLPAVVSGVVVSLLWSWIYNSEFGLFNNFLLKFGINGPRWLSDEHWIMPALIIMSIWGIGGSIIMYLSGLQGIPRYLYESAKLDAANWWTRLTKITLPSMSPIILFTGLTSVIGALQTFTQAYVMTSGGPNNASLFYAYYVYKHAFVWKQMGKACALAWILFIVIFLITVILLKASKSKIYYESKDGGDIL
ncbi:MAG: sugar ABC transporter permease [Clostridia bacterium]|nr:sugar ABC transporter permease [Clostridia bacterium]